MKDREIELLTAFVDGELSSRERRAVVKLLHRSSEARALLAQLQENAHGLKQLPRHKGPDVSAAVVQAILQPAEKDTSATHDALKRPAPIPDTSTNHEPLRRRWPLGRGPLSRVAMAAAVLLAIAGSYFYFSRPDENPPPIANDNNNNNARPAEQRIAFQDLRQEDKQRELTKELNKQAAFHVDVRVAQTGPALARVREVFQKQGIQVLADAATEASLAKGNGSYVVYLENVQPEEVTGVLSRLAIDDAQVATGSLLVHAMSAEDRKLLASFMGVDPNAFDPARKDDKLILDTVIIPKAKEKGKTKDTPPSTPVAAERFAVVFQKTDNSSHADTTEVQTFLKSRQPRQPGTVQVLLTIHSQA